MGFSEVLLLVNLRHVLSRAHVQALPVVLVGIAWLSLALWKAETAPFSIDELIYRAMADSLAGHHALSVGNGYEEYPSQSLKLTLFIESGGHLYPQYPSGWAFVAAPAYWLAGPRGLLLLNTLATLGTLYFIWLAARSLLGGSAAAHTAVLLYALSTFAVEYALGIWPHALSVFLLTVAFYLFATCRGDSVARDSRAVLLGGLVIGLAVNVRVDAAIALVPALIWVVAVFDRPLPAIVRLLAGVLPGLLAASILNGLKFGIFLPVTYGRPGLSGGPSSLAFYQDLVLPAIAATGLLAWFCRRALRTDLMRSPVLWTAVAVAAVGILLLPLTRELALRMMRGVFHLVIDFQSYLAGSTQEVAVAGDGTYRFAGVIKKSLVQSVPYIAGLPLLLVPLLRGCADRRWLWYVLFPLAWLAPFAFGSFHGGLASNMRYLAPMLPPLCILAVLAWQQSRPQASSWRAIVGVACIALVASAAPSHMAGLSAYYAWGYSVPGFLAAGLLVLSIVMAAVQLAGEESPPLGALWKGVFLAAAFSAFLTAYWLDLDTSQGRRASNADVAAHVASLPPRSLMLAFRPESLDYRLNLEGAMTAQAEWREGHRRYDPGLVLHAFATGRKVFVQDRGLAQSMVRDGVAVDARPLFGLDPMLEIHELVPSKDSPRQF